MSESSTEGDDRSGGVDRNLGENGEVLAAVHIRADMGNGCMCQNDERERRKLPVD